MLGSVINNKVVKLDDVDETYDDISEDMSLLMDDLEDNMTELNGIVAVGNMYANWDYDQEDVIIALEDRLRMIWDNIKRLFGRMIEKIKSFVRDRLTKRDVKWVEKNKDAILAKRSKASRSTYSWREDLNMDKVTKDIEDYGNAFVDCSEMNAEINAIFMKDEEVTNKLQKIGKFFTTFLSKNSLFNKKTINTSSVHDAKLDLKEFIHENTISINAEQKAIEIMATSKEKTKNKATDFCTEKYMEQFISYRYDKKALTDLVSSLIAMKKSINVTDMVTPVKEDGTREDNPLAQELVKTAKMLLQIQIRKTNRLLSATATRRDDLKWAFVENIKADKEHKSKEKK